MRLAAGRGEREEIVGIGRYDRIDTRSAEVAFNISDHYQGKGIGSVLLHLAWSLPAACGSAPTSWSISTSAPN